MGDFRLLTYHVRLLWTIQSKEEEEEKKLSKSADRLHDFVFVSVFVLYGKISVYLTNV